MKEISWLKNRGYLHLNSPLNLKDDRKKVESVIKNQKFIAKYAFFPLIHSVINERRYKLVDSDSGKRAHSFQSKSGEHLKTVKHRPLHYANHLDAIIFGYYAEILQIKYEERLKQTPLLSECVTAYRRIAIDNSDKNKSTIHFANDAFAEIKHRESQGCIVLKFDIKSFFSRLNHDKLKSAWSKLIGVQRLPDDHFNVFKAATNFSYVLKDDLRLPYAIGKRRSGFDEKKLSDLRKKGIQAFFESPKHFREAVKDKQIRIHKHPFRDSDGTPVGIPQGLPISAVLANLYLLEFDLKIIDEVVKKFDAFYRRYSDDIIIVCSRGNRKKIENLVYELILESKVEMSTDKTEVFEFSLQDKGGIETLVSSKLTGSEKKSGIPFTYLGFEFYGSKTLIKSANLAKFYRRMIQSVKSKTRRAYQISLRTPNSPIIVFRQQLYRSYTVYPLESTKIFEKKKILVKNDRGDFFYQSIEKPKKHRSNYMSYVKRASTIMNDQAIKHQMRNHKKIFNDAINKQIERVKNRY